MPRPRWESRSSFGGLRHVLGLHARDADAEMRARALEHFDRSLVQQHVFLDDGQAQAAAFDRRNGNVRAAIERLEDFLALRSRDAGAFVEDLEDGIAALLVELEGNEAHLR